MISDSWYPRWKARVDGQESIVYRVNNSMRGVVSSRAGAEIELYYDEENLKTFLIISIATLLFVFTFGTFDHFKNENSIKEKNNKP